MVLRSGRSKIHSGHNDGWVEIPTTMQLVPEMLAYQTFYPGYMYVLLIELIVRQPHGRAGHVIFHNFSTLLAVASHFFVGERPLD